MQLKLESRRKLKGSKSPANIDGIYNSKSNHTAEEISTKIPFCAEVNIQLD